MKLIACAAALLTLAAPAIAQTTPTPPAPAADATAAKFSLDTPIETLVADPAAKAVLDADIPGMTAHPAYDQFKTMSLKQLQPLSQGQITDETLTKIAGHLAAIK